LRIFDAPEPLFPIIPIIFEAGNSPDEPFLRSTSKPLSKDQLFIDEKLNSIFFFLY
jgi:hypothetical protein